MTDSKTPPANDLDALAASSEYSPAGIEVPDQVKAWVEAGFDHWKKFPSQWRNVTLATKEGAEKILEQARYYCANQRAERLSIQTRKEGTGPVETDGKVTGHRLVYRVRTRVQSGRKGATPDA